MNQQDRGEPIERDEFKRIRSQLVVNDNVLMRSVKLPPNEVVTVPVIPCCLEEKLMRRAHSVCGHGSWEATWRLLGAECFFPDMALKCQEYVKSCTDCVAASASKGKAAPPSCPAVAPGPWSIVQIDTLELGANRSGKFHCVLVCVDVFTKWVEVVPLRKHNAECVASAFVDLCARFGPPAVIRSDDTEFVNCIMTALLDTFGVHVSRGAVRHPKPQGGVERFNRTLLTLIRKVLDEADDWQRELQLLLYSYHIRPHSATQISPFLAMHGWQPRDLLVSKEHQQYTLSAWVDKLSEQSAHVRDFVERELSSADFVEQEFQNPYFIGDPVMLKAQDGRQK